MCDSVDYLWFEHKILQLILLSTTTAALFIIQFGGRGLVSIQLSVGICSEVLYCKDAVAAESLKRGSRQLVQLHKSSIIQTG